MLRIERETVYLWGGGGKRERDSLILVLVDHVIKYSSCKLFASLNGSCKLLNSCCVRKDVSGAEVVMLINEKIYSLRWKQNRL